MSWSSYGVGGEQSPVGDPAERDAYIRRKRLEYEQERERKITRDMEKEVKERERKLQEFEEGIREDDRRRKRIAELEAAYNQMGLEQLEKEAKRYGKREQSRDRDREREKRDKEREKDRVEHRDRERERRDREEERDRDKHRVREQDKRDRERERDKVEYWDGEREKRDRKRDRERERRDIEEEREREKDRVREQEKRDRERERDRVEYWDRKRERRERNRERERRGDTPSSGSPQGSSSPYHTKAQYYASPTSMEEPTGNANRQRLWVYKDSADLEPGRECEHVPGDAYHSIVTEAVNMALGLLHHPRGFHCLVEIGHSAIKEWDKKKQKHAYQDHPDKLVKRAQRFLRKLEEEFVRVELSTSSPFAGWFEPYTWHHEGQRGVKDWSPSVAGKIHLNFFVSSNPPSFLSSPLPTHDICHEACRRMLTRPVQRCSSLCSMPEVKTSPKTIKVSWYNWGSPWHTSWSTALWAC
jgi:hypothetical protein